MYDYKILIGKHVEERTVSNLNYIQTFDWSNWVKTTDNFKNVVPLLGFEIYVSRMQVESNLIHAFISIKSPNELYYWYTVCLTRMSTARICSVERLNENK